MSASSLARSFHLDRWVAVEERFAKERQDYDFETRSFIVPDQQHPYDSNHKSSDETGHNNKYQREDSSGGLDFSHTYTQTNSSLHGLVTAGAGLVREECPIAHHDQASSSLRMSSKAWPKQLLLDPSQQLKQLSASTMGAHSSSATTGTTSRAQGTAAQAHETWQAVTQLSRSNLSKSLISPALIPKQRKKLFKIEVSSSGSDSDSHGAASGNDSLASCCLEEEDPWARTEPTHTIVFTKPNLDQLAVHNLTMIGRDEELAQLERFYDSPDNENAMNHPGKKMAMIVGPSGSGKSVLATELQKRLRYKYKKMQHRNSMGLGEDGDDLPQQCPLFCAGKFDAQNRADPYHAIVQALTSLMQQMKLKWDYITLSHVQKQMAETLGDEMKILLELVPSLSLILSMPGGDLSNSRSSFSSVAFSDWGVQEESPSTKRRKRPRQRSKAANEEQERHDEDQNEQQPELAATPQLEQSNIIESAARIQNVLVEFFHLISTPQHPVTLLLDDIQWAGSASLGLLDALLIDLHLANNPYFFILTTCRQEYLPMITERIDDKDGDENLDLDMSSASSTSSSASSVAVNTQLIQLMQRHAARIHRLTVAGLDVPSVQNVINVLLRVDEDLGFEGCSPDNQILEGKQNEETVTHRSTYTLAKIVHRKTGGNPFFVLSFMQLLVDEGWLQYDINTFQWNWLEGEIQSQNVADNVAQAVQKRLGTLQSQDLLILQVASCISNSFDQDMIQFVLLGLQVEFEESWLDVDWPQGELIARMDYLVSIGILEAPLSYFHDREQESTSGIYDFAHDQIQDAAHRLIPEGRKIQMKRAIGKRLIEGLDRGYHRDQFLFTAVQLYGTGMDQIPIASSDKKHYAFWTFLAGDTAMKQGAFDAALSFFERSHKCLGSNPFQRDCELALPLFCCATEAAYCVGLSDRVEEYIEMVQSQTSIPEYQKIRISLVKIKMLSGKRDFEGCVDVFRETVKQLGVCNLPKQPSIFRTLWELTKTTNLLKRYDRRKIQELPVCTDPNIIGALSTFTSSFYQLYLCNPNLCVIATCKAVRWSLKHGHSPATPSVLAIMGMLLVGVTGDAKKAHEIGEAALELCDSYGYKTALPQTVGIVFGFVRCWTKPMQDFLTPMRYAIDIGTRLGIMDDVSFLVNTYGFLMILTQTATLPTTIKELQGFRHMMIEMKHIDHLSFTEINLQFAIKMANVNLEDPENNFLMTGDIVSEDKILLTAEQNKDVALSAYFKYLMASLQLYFGRPVVGADLAENLLDFGVKYSQGAHCVPRVTFILGLVSVLAFKEDKKLRRLRVAEIMKKRLAKWTKQGNPNAVHFLHLLRAELFSVKKKRKLALEEYSAAVKSSMRAGFKMDFALSSELLSLFYASSPHTGNEETRLKEISQARFHMGRALKAYVDYGAANKAKHLHEIYPDLLCEETDSTVPGFA
uniref:Orc1-like AAA ATPase domain-containing protein n=1 Tax=Entomoneis paludosa TaxID=265537 RepID=A0A7S3DXD2_9STRA|mmetsp:Transcript_5790/g.12212  ORF Transcript_5790/g.12212 Transcript_5790/m.12212 type:complete len:1433 (+) Transcript_5790:376-4674(+)|eukprot:CAMPEP_0172475856 /NCGR_PEP_ID=MMETSP1065-20121228/70083_1 /TAXON_ID=265537 /ORGANISM="Amphiprora paludosa, Strain CCMP125" /LENGTH=1432 /DNA_ID=CAMNT_0013234071 /DNA_START=795 /DNA_END=5093 /DNA_ORIENTATION=+